MGKVRQFVAVDIGGTQIKISLIDENANFLDEIHTLDTPNGNLIVSSISEFIEANYQNFDGIGVSSAGVIDPVKGEVVFSGPTIPDYINQKIKEPLEQKFNKPVSAENDVNAALLGEYWQGAAKDTSSCFMATIGTGVGGAILLNGELWRGSSLSAGEVGYLNFNGKHYQEEASSLSMVNIAKEKFYNPNLNGKIIFEEAIKGNQAYKTLIEDMIDSLTIGLSDIIYVLNPETIVLGGGVMEQVEYLEPLIHKYLDKHLLNESFKPKHIRFASCGNKAGMLGAVYKLIKELG